MSYLTNSRRLNHFVSRLFWCHNDSIIFDHYAVALENKEMICIVSQMCYSETVPGWLRIFPSSAKLIDTHHINMPNNYNIPFVPLATSGRMRRKVVAVYEN